MSQQVATPTRSYSHTIKMFEATLKNYDDRSVFKPKVPDGDRVYVEMYDPKQGGSTVVCFKDSTVSTRNSDGTLTAVSDLEWLFGRKVEVKGTFDVIGRRTHAVEVCVIEMHD